MKGLLAALATQVHVYYDDGGWSGPTVPGGGAGESRSDLAVVTPVELARANAYRRLEDARSFLAGRSFLRTVLARYLGCRPADVPLRPTAPGTKPRLDCAEGADQGDQAYQTEQAALDLEFSISRAGRHRVVAVTAGRRVGVDVEAWRGPRAVRSLDHLPVDLALSDAEVAAWRDLPPARSARAFVGAWTRKEAVVKASGLGLTGLPPASFSVGFAASPAIPAGASPLPLGAVPPPAGVPGAWQLFAADDAEHGVSIAVATEGTPCVARWMR